MVASADTPVVFGMIFVVRIVKSSFWRGRHQERAVGLYGAIEAFTMLAEISLFKVKTIANPLLIYRAEIHQMYSWCQVFECSLIEIEDLTIQPRVAEALTRHHHLNP